MKKALIIGSGFAGSVMARELAEAGFTVLIFEKRGHIGGNMYEYKRKNGVRVHKYGPHIFHTNSQKVFSYLSRFSDFYPYAHHVLGHINSQLVPIPFNFTSIDALFTADHAAIYKSKLSGSFPGKDHVYISELITHPDPDICEIGRFVYENVFVHYTAKQWGVPVSQVDVSVINRVPVVLGTDNRYFSDTIQMMPVDGYTPLFEKMLDHPNIKVLLETNAADHINLSFESNTLFLDGKPFDGPVCYTGALDELFGYKLGPLPYRSLDMRFEDYPVDYYQESPVINYPNDQEYTRITEFKHMTHQVTPGQTTILKEYPLPYIPGGLIPPCYPIASRENQKRYDAYLDLSRGFRNLYLCGRLAEYRYYNMDIVIERALQESGLILEKG